MNHSQKNRYGALPTYTDPLRRHCECPYCDYRASRARRGRGNARAVMAVLRGEVMQHMRDKHAEALGTGD